VQHEAENCPGSGQRTLKIVRKNYPTNLTGGYSWNVTHTGTTAWNAVNIRILMPEPEESAEPEPTVLSVALAKAGL
jgi:hypothetical protein